MPKKTTLSNGVRVVTERVPGVRSVSVGCWFAVGSRDERPGEEGLAHLVEHMMFKGTTRRSARVIAETMDATGGHLNAFTTKESTSYYARVLDQHVPLALDLLADMLQHSAFAEDELSREKEVILEEIGMAEDAPEDLIHEMFDAHFFAEHPLARSVLGTRSSVLRQRREDIVNFVERHYTPDNMVIAAAGNVDHGELVALVERLFDKEPADVRSARSLRPFVYAPRRVSVDKDTEQVHICVGAPGLVRSDERRFALELLDIIVGGGMSSRMFQQLRENRGLVYSTYSFSTSYTDVGVFGVYAATRPERADEALEVIHDELAKLAAGDIVVDEVNRAREQAKGSLMLALESTASRMGRLAGAELWNEPYLRPEELIERLDRVTVDDVRALAGELLAADKLSVVQLGPSEGTARAATLEAIG